MKLQKLTKIRITLTENDDADVSKKAKNYRLYLARVTQNTRSALFSLRSLQKKMKD